MSERRLVRVRDVMTDHFATVDGVMTVAESLARMKREDAQVLIVDKRGPDDEYGIVLLRDIAQQVLARHRAPERVNIYEIMSKPVIAVAPTMDIRYCARLFDRFGLSYAPVIDNGELVGIVSYAHMVLDGLDAGGA